MAEQRYAIVIDGRVWSVTVWDPETAPGWQPPAGTPVPCGPDTAVGDTHADGVFTRTPSPEPTPEDTLAKIKAYLIAHPDVAAAIQP